MRHTIQKLFKEDEVWLLAQLRECISNRFRARFKDAGNGVSEIVSNAEWDHLRDHVFGNDFVAFILLIQI
jgi:hypothetical protein